MTTFAARQAKNSFGLLMETVQREPVTIEKNGRPSAVVLSKHRYDEMQAELAELRSERETAFLLSGRNGARLLQAVERHRNGEDGVATTLAQLEAMARDAD